MPPRPRRLAADHGADRTGEAGRHLLDVAGGLSLLTDSDRTPLRVLEQVAPRLARSPQRYRHLCLVTHRNADAALAVRILTHITSKQVGRISAATKAGVTQPLWLQVLGRLSEGNAAAVFDAVDHGPLLTDLATAHPTLLNAARVNWLADLAVISPKAWPWTGTSKAARFARAAGLRVFSLMLPFRVRTVPTFSAGNLQPCGSRHVDGDDDV